LAWTNSQHVVSGNIFVLAYWRRLSDDGIFENFSIPEVPLKWIARQPSEKAGSVQVAEAAYFIALKRGFALGYEAADCAAAEKEVNAFFSEPSTESYRQ